MPATDQQHTKACSKCGHVQDIAEFVRDARRPDGLYPHCRTCSAEYRRARAASNAMGTCVKEGCARPRRYREPGYCIMHYKRWKKSGSAGAVGTLAEQRDTTCAFCGAEGKIIHDSSYSNGGLCEMHHGRWRRDRDLGPVDRLTQICPLDGQCTHVQPDGVKCTNAYLAGGLCSLHYNRVADGRHPDDPGKDIRISDADAVQQMLAAGAEPQGPYVRSDAKWLCRCLTCGRAIHTTLETVRQGRNPCWYCSKSRVDPAEAASYMLTRGLQVLDPWPGRVDRRWRGLHVGTPGSPGCMGEVSPTYHSVKTHGQGVCFDCGERGYSTTKPGAFYVVANTGLIKCGIANMRNFRSRLRHHETKQGLTWQWVFGHEDGRVAWSLEKTWKSFRAEHPEWHVTKADLRDGYTEAMRRTPGVDAFIDDLMGQTNVHRLTTVNGTSRASRSPAYGAEATGVPMKGQS